MRDDPGPEAGSADRLGLARGLLGLSLVLSLVGLGGPWLGQAWNARQHGEQNLRFTRILGLSRPALWPSGRPSRAPETIHPGVDLRPAPGFPRAEPGMLPGGGSTGP